jgi:hypothetical protein
MRRFVVHLADPRSRRWPPPPIRAAAAAQAPPRRAPRTPPAAATRPQPPPSAAGDAEPTRRAACSSRPTAQFHRRPRHQHRRRPGALSALPGRPRRLLFSERRYSFAKPDGTGFFHARADNVGWRDQEYFADYDRAGKLSLTGLWEQIPQFYSVDTMTPYTGSGGTLLLDDATQRAIQNGRGSSTPTSRSRRSSSCASGATSARRRRRDADAEARRHGQLHDAEARRRAAVGRQLRLQQRRRGAAALRLADQRLHHRHRVDEHAQHAARRLQRIVVRQPRDRRCLGQPAAPRRRVGRAGPRPHVAVAVELGADDQRRRLHQAGAQDAGHRLLLLRPVEQRRAAAAVHDQFGAAPDRAAARQRRGRGARLLDQPEPDVAPGPPTGGSARASATTPTTTRCRRRASRSTSATTRASTTPTGGPDLYAHSRTTFDADATWTKLKPLALTVGYTHNGNGYDARIFESSGEDVFRVSADAVGSSWATFRANTSRQPHRIRPDEKADEIGEQPRRCATTTSPTGREPLHRAGRHRPVDAWTFSVSGGVLQDDFSDSFFGLQESTGRTFSLAPTTTCRTAWARAPATTTSATPDCSNRTRGIRQRAVQRSAAQLDGRLDRDGPLLLDLRDAAAHRPQHRGAVLVRLQPRRGQLPLHDSRRAARSRRPISCPTCSTSCSSCTSTSAPADEPLAATFSYLYEPLRIYDFAFDPSVVNGIVQPSSLVMGYVYRPYTANSFNVRRSVSLVDHRR